MVDWKPCPLCCKSIYRPLIAQLWVTLVVGELFSCMENFNRSLELAMMPKNSEKKLNNN